MLATIILWAYVFLLSTLYGFGLVQGLPLQPGRRPVSLLALLGLAVISALAGLLSLVINLGLAANLLLLLGDVGLGIWQRRALAEFARTQWQALTRLHWLTALAFCTVFVVILLKSTQPPLNYDTGLYHAQAIRWMETYPAVPGLGNLYDRLVFNSSWLLLSALFSFSFTGLQSFHSLGALLAVILTGYALGKFDRLLKGDVTVSNASAVLLPFLLRRIFSLELSSPGTDLPAALIIWIVVTISLEKIDERAESCFDFNFLAAAALSLLAVTIKLSTLPILLLPLFFALKMARPARVTALAALAGLAALLLVPWMARGHVQSGYLAFPLAESGFLAESGLLPADWQIPEGNARGAAGWIRSWAKIPTPDREAVERMALAEWLPIWLNNQEPLDRQILLINAAALLVLLATFATHALRKGIRGPLASYAVVVVITLLGIAFWFLQAPAMRFGYAFLGILPVLAAALPMAGLAARFPRLGHWGALGVLAVLLLYQGISAYRLADPSILRPVVLLPAGYPQVDVQAHSFNGLTIYTPTQGDQCWYEPFPCVPAIDSQLQMRGQTVEEGFRIE